MAFETFIALVAFLALAYAGASRYLQNRLVDKSEMEAIQAESKRLSAEMKTAQERKDEARVQELMKQQMEFLPKMNKVMMGQFKPMIFILGVFFALMWVIGQVDPTVQDDITLNMTDDGLGCDAAAGDGTYSACYALANANYGKWVFTAHSVRGGADVGTNYTWFAYNAEVSDNFTEAPKGEPIGIRTDKKSYSPGETVKLYATPSAKPDQVRAVLSNGTSFYVDLPMAIPLLNVQRIQQPYWWFIFVSFIASLVISGVIGQLGKKKKDADAGKWAGERA
ncbi:MAG: EMC3/TMCO1 family protein [Candidatus ainarchaeum sp.]|nr:EMC3/TMCO1 family protein [Candidatus ainarchaeum sp.]